MYNSDKIELIKRIVNTQGFEPEVKYQTILKVVGEYTFDDTTQSGVLMDGGVTDLFNRAVVAKAEEGIQ